MKIPFLNLEILRTRTKALTLNPLSGSTGWWPIIRESYSGAWQSNVEVSASSALTNPTVFACTTRIATDVAKLRFRLVEKDADGIWTEAESPAFSPLLRRPNRYQTIHKYIEQYITSKLTNGNVYALKERDRRGVVVALYVLDPTRVTPLVTPDGAVYYQLRRDDLSGIRPDTVTVPASEIIHDTMVTLYHPLVGVSPIYACGVAAVQGLSIQNNSQKFFTNGSNPGGVLTAPGSISDATALRLKAYWDENYTGDNVGKVAVLGDGLKYEAMAVNAVDSQLIEQLKWTGETICSCYGMPAYMVGIGPPPPYANVEPLVQAYYSQCLQSLLVNCEAAHDHGLGISEKVDSKQYGTEFDVDDLIWMDTTTRNKAASDAIGSGGMSPNEARKKYYGLGPVEGGSTPYLQVQNYSLSALFKRDSGESGAAPNADARTSDPDIEDVDTAEEAAGKMARFRSALHAKSLRAGLRAA